MEFNLGEVKESTYFQTSIQYTGSKQISYLEPVSYTHLTSVSVQKY